ncbi:hypothetical protein FQN54_006451 [Arachnomyces sp. PD_36]|nr:hypothetical protein FQN54_006451 [Arachnomyces sp. PD_36]
MANPRMAEQGHTRYNPASAGLLGYSRLSFVRRTNSYGFPRGKAQSFFYPEPSLRRSSSTRPLHSSSNILDTMPKQPAKVPSLELSSSNFKDTSKEASPLSSDTLSPLTPSSSKSTPNSPFAKGSTIRSVTGRAFISEKTFLPPHSPNRSLNTDGSDTPITPTLTAIPPYPPSPKDSKHNRDPSRSFFGNLKASKSSHRIQASEGSNAERPSKSRGNSKDRIMYSSKAQSSTADLPRSPGAPPESRGGEGNDTQTQSNTSSGVGRQDSEPLHPPLVNKKSKPRFVDMLTRTRSIKVDEGPSTGKYPKPSRRPSNGLLKLEELSNQEAQAQDQQGLKTAPLQTDRAFREAMGSTTRNRSADRPSTSTNEENNAIKKERSYGVAGPMSQTTSARDGYTGQSLFNNLKQSSTGAADRLGKAGMKAGKGIFGKITRSGSSHERDLVTDDIYTCSVINLPLIEQTRKTRISKGLDRSKDKTEYWMPALPWRCIDYLNFKGCEEEGLYRVPGSGKEVKHWQRRFDSELDIDLFEEPELYDINIIGSMFKAWLRELPDEIFPKKTQSMIAEKCMGATEVPQLLKDELSKLPPFNYYLLFAITCHLSLLHSYVDKNKMDYRNLCICFQPCMKIDGFCFQFLVCEWKHCWQGCWTEKEFLKAELEAEKEGEKAASKPSRDGKGRKPSSSSSRSNANDRAISSSGSSQPPRTAGSTSGAAGSGAGSGGDETKSSSRSGSPSRGRRPAPKRLDSSHMRSASQLPELGPPLSPIKI